jgi:hypothetical protein
VEAAMLTSWHKFGIVTLLLLVVIFAALFAQVTLVRQFVPSGWLLIVFGVAFAVLGLVLVGLTVLAHESRIRKTFLLLAGGSAAAMPICAVLHTVVYALLIRWFGEEFWEQQGTDEAPFFILAVIVCPALFLIGTAGSIAYLAKDLRS